MSYGRELELVNEESLTRERLRRTACVIVLAGYVPTIGHLTVVPVLPVINRVGTTVR
jgi:hypothetical protein